MFSSKDLFFTPTSGAFTVSKSLRFRGSATAYLNRTPGSSGNRTTWTWSGWIKRGSLGSSQDIFDTSNGAGTVRCFLRFNSTDAMYFQFDASTASITTTSVYRDPSAWYHIVLAADSTQSTNTNRLRLYVNGVQVTTGTFNYPTLSANSDMNIASQAFTIGRYTNTGEQFDGYMAEVNFLDGYPTVGGTTYNATTWAALNVATLFGAYDTNGIWQPAAYTGSYGTNGFYLKFTDVGATSGSNTGYGKDFAGTNYWTTNNFGTTSTATTYDSMLDSPTNATGDIGNYPILNPLSFNGANVVDGNLAYLGANNTSTRASFVMPTSGKWYWELTPVDSSPNYVGFGLMGASTTGTNNYGTAAAGLWGLYPTTTMYLSINGSAVNTTVSTPTLGVVFAAAYDADTGNFWIGYASSGSGSPTWFNSTGGTTGNPATGANPVATISAQTLFPAVSGNNTTANKGAINFGQRPFALTVPSGYSSLNTQNLTTPTITNGAQYMAATLWDGDSTYPRTISNGANNTIGTTFQPDFVWMKARSTAYSNILYDAVRGTGTGASLVSNATSVEGASSINANMSAFAASGFTIGSTSSTNILNISGQTFVGWQWKAANATTTGYQPSGATISCSYNANASAGFSIVKYVGNGTNNSTIGHGLGAAPSLIIIKRTDGTNGWDIYHVSNGAQKYMDFTASGVGSLSTIFPTVPTSSLFYIGSTGGQNTLNGNYVAYLWAPVSGFSSFGQYSGNSSTDGSYIYLGFRPRWLLIKGIGSGGSGWMLLDTSRDTYNVSTSVLRPDLDAAASTGYGNVLDILSNGFKLRSTDTNSNSSSTTYGPYIYAAFAENPFKISRAR